MIRMIVGKVNECDKVIGNNDHDTDRVTLKECDKVIGNNDHDTDGMEVH
jgi:hypothetical protein